MSDPSITVTITPDHVIMVLYGLVGYLSYSVARMAYQSDGWKFALFCLVVTASTFGAALTLLLLAIRFIAF